MRAALNLRKVCLSLTGALVSLFSAGLSFAQIDDAADLQTQQMQERNMMEDMRREMGDLKSTMQQGAQAMQGLQQQIANRPLELKLSAKEMSWEVAPGAIVTALTYNASTPGPVLRVKEGQPVKLVLKNELKVPTSLILHGILLPHSVNGLPRKGAGLVEPGQTYVYQFYAPKAGTYWYHPQVMHLDQMARGLAGALISEPAAAPRTYERDVVIVLSDFKSGKGGIYYTMNGKCAPAIAPLEVTAGERIRLRLINAASIDCPLFFSGHQFEIASLNGSTSLEPRVTRDTLTLHPGDRCELDFTANNPGVWSFASMLPAQTTTDGRFPGGMAMVVKYPER